MQCSGTFPLLSVDLAVEFCKSLICRGPRIAMLQKRRELAACRATDGTDISTEFVAGATTFLTMAAVVILALIFAANSQ